MSEQRTITVEVLRASPLAGVESRWQRYGDVPIEDGMSVTNVLYRVNELFDGSLAYRVSCHRGICASCMMKVNGKRVLACSTVVEGDLKLEPAFPDRVIKDLVVEQQ
jgi:succinate dehydrogenase/fumarate reductase-like Fe-S protein